MGSSLKLENLEQGFMQAASSTVIVMNDLDDSSEKQKKEINNLLYNVAGDIYTNIPSCECTRLKKAYLIDAVCPNCGTKVVRRMEQNIQPIVWLRAPKGVAPFINPKVWYLLNDYFNRNNFEVIRYIADTSYKPAAKAVAKAHDTISKIQDQGITGRGWNYFVQNFDFIISKLIESPHTRRSGKSVADYQPLLDVLARFRNEIFTHYLPLPNRSLMVIEENDSGRYRDPLMDAVVDAARTLTGIDLPTSTASQATKERRLVKALDLLTEYYDANIRINSKKEGIWRKHIFGTRSHWASRAVISSITEPHRYNEIYLPWGLAVSLLEIHLMNKLFKRGFSEVKATNFLNTYALEYHPLLDELFKELISESPFGGIGVIHTRNPVMGPGSTELLFATRVKTDVTDDTVSTSILAVTPFNLDFKIH